MPDHGIEPPDAREASGKPARATVSLSAYYQGSHVIIEVKDDGAGLNTERILESARRKGLIAPDADPAPEDIHRLIFEPGFSTAAKVTEVSGRGVGMPREAIARGAACHVASLLRMPSLIADCFAKMLAAKTH